MYPQPHYNDILFKKLRLCCRPDSVVKCFKVHCEKVYYKVSLIKIEMCAKNASTASSQLLKGRTSCTEDKTIFYHACLWWRPCGRHPSGGQRPRFLFMSHDLWRSKESTWGWDWLLREMQCCQIGSESLQYRESWRRLCRSNARHCASFLSLAVLWRFDQDQSQCHDWNLPVRWDMSSSSSIHSSHNMFTLMYSRDKWLSSYKQLHCLQNQGLYFKTTNYVVIIIIISFDPALICYHHGLFTHLV